MSRQTVLHACAYACVFLAGMGLASAARAQQSPACPQLPGEAGLTWEYRGSGGTDLCRALRADGSEAFDTTKDGAPAVEAPEKGEVVWRDDHGVTCRRWNWRQGVRTRLNADARRMWFILESLAPMPIEALQEASDKLVAGLHAMSSHAQVDARLIKAS